MQGGGDPCGYDSPVHPVETLGRDYEGIGATELELLRGGTNPLKRGVVCARVKPGRCQHGLRRIDRVDSLRSLGQGNGDIAPAASQVEQDPRAIGEETLEDIEELGRVGRPGGVGARNALVSELIRVLGAKVCRLLLHDQLLMHIRPVPDPLEPTLKVKAGRWDANKRLLGREELG